MNNLDFEKADTKSASKLRSGQPRSDGNRMLTALGGMKRFKGKRPETIEIVIAPRQADMTAHRKNVGIELDEFLLLKILSDHYRHVRITQIDSRRDLEQIAVRRPNLVFSGVKFFTFDGEELWLNDFLDLHGVAYIASGRSALLLERDKACAKSVVSKAGVATADYFVAAPGDHETVGSVPLAFPLFVKPLIGGDSRGVDSNSVVHDFESLKRKVLEIHETQDSRAIVETYLPGREYSVGILEDVSSGTLRTMPIEIVTDCNRNGDRILDFDVKRQDLETVAPVKDATVRLRLGNLAKAAFRSLGGKSLGRIDIKMSSDDVPHFIEANLMPGLRKGYFYRGCLLNFGMSYEAMILTIAENGLASRIEQIDSALTCSSVETSIQKTISAAYLGMSESKFPTAPFTAGRAWMRGGDE